MQIRKTTITNKTGLHARPASDFVACASKFESEITVRRVDDDEEADAKSIVMLLILALDMGSEIEIIADGKDETEAVNELACLVESKFGED